MDRSFLEEERQLLLQANNVTTLVEFFTWAENRDELVNQLEERSRATFLRALYIGCAQSTVASIARLLGAKKHLYGRYVHQGGEYASTSAADGDGDKKTNELDWREIETAFKSHIATGVVINTNYIDPLCLHYFSSSEKFKVYIVDCGTLNNCAIRLPNEDDKWLSFSNHDNKERVPFIVYADLECVLRKIDPPSSPEQTTFNYQRHEVFSVGYYVRCSFDESLSRYEYYRGLDCIEWFVEQLVKLAHRVETIILKTVPMETLSNAQREEHENATVCHVCESPFAVDEKRVRDHCHMTGRYRGPAHSKCNLQYRDTRYIPVVFHNLSGYDAHFVIKEITTAYEGKVDLLPITKEKYISFTKHVNDTAKGQDLRTAIKLRFIDSNKFLNVSLDKLSSLLIKDKMRILRGKFAKILEENFDLLTRKGIFPYEYVDSVEKLDESSLPSRESFFSSLTGDTVSETDYAHAETVWQQFSIQTLGEYSNLYLKTDVLLLADVFENFRDRCVESNGLDPAHYYTLLGFTWDAMLKHTRINFELLTDIDMPLPYADFEWVNDEDLANFDVDAIAVDSPTDYILEVDLEYPASVHDMHPDLPFCPTREKPPGAKHDKKTFGYAVP
ncbi:uncharacterized protein [Cardiocondyla obscurior]|uniref:uncharacterized protein n=1 Tax=Cardiocondyla obscurior TaxID=286306 RepID=UPI0039657DAD